MATERRHRNESEALVHHRQECRAALGELTATLRRLRASRRAIIRSARGAEVLGALPGGRRRLTAERWAVDCAHDTAVKLEEVCRLVRLDSNSNYRAEALFEIQREWAHAGRREAL